MKTLAAIVVAAGLAASQALAETAIRTVTFENEGATLSGTLYLPAAAPGKPLPAVVVTDAWTSVREQMPRVYAREMVARDFTPFSPARGGRAFPVDMDGRPVHVRKLQDPGSIDRCRLTDDGTPFVTQGTLEGPPPMAGKCGPPREHGGHGNIAREDCDDSRRHDSRRPATWHTLRIAREVPDDAPHPGGRVQKGTIA